MKIFHLVPSVLVNENMVEENTEKKLNEIISRTYNNKQKLPSDIQNKIINSALKAKNDKRRQKKREILSKIAEQPATVQPLQIEKIPEEKEVLKTEKKDVAAERLSSIKTAEEHALLAVKH